MLYVILNVVTINWKHFFYFSVSILTFSHGIGLGWLSPTLSRPLHFDVTVTDASWIGSLLGLGSMCGNIVIGTLQNIVGRKIALYFLALPHMVSKSELITHTYRHLIYNM